MTDQEDVAVSCAAIRVLGELKVKEVTALKQLGLKLKAQPDAVRLAVLEAFIANPQAGNLPYLVPLLKEEGALRRKAIHAIGVTGNKAISFLDKEFKTATLNEKKLFSDIFATIRSKAA